jgi:hypothetical protein
MMDKMIARWMGWSYAEQNPGHRFMVFVRHTPYVPSYVWPTSSVVLSNEPVTENSKSNKKYKRPKRAVIKNLRCIVPVESIDQLSKLMHKDTHLDFQILHFVEEERKKTFLNHGIGLVMAITKANITTTYMMLFTKCFIIS